jgi:dTDP-4-dehydrorhamnose 3,5-epimerase
MSYKDFVVTTSKKFEDVIIIKPSVYWDLRGNIYSTFNKDFYKEILSKELDFKHDKIAYSKYNVLRGLHGDFKTWKLVSCVWGKIFEVLVDMRPESKNYKKWDGFWLCADDYTQILIPPGFVNGYYVESEHAVFHYKLGYDGEYVDAGEQMTFSWKEPELCIIWPCTDPILQPRDKV